MKLVHSKPSPITWPLLRLYDHFPTVYALHLIFGGTADAPASPRRAVSGLAASAHPTPLVSSYPPPFLARLTLRYPSGSAGRGVSPWNLSLNLQVEPPVLSKCHLNPSSLNTEPGGHELLGQGAASPLTLSTVSTRTSRPGKGVGWEGHAG